MIMVSTAHPCVENTMVPAIRKAQIAELRLYKRLYVVEFSRKCCFYFLKIKKNKTINCDEKW